MYVIFNIEISRDINSYKSSSKKNVDLLKRWSKYI